MSAWIHLTKKQIPYPDKYTLEYTIENSYGIEKELFVHTLEGAFSHVATLSDLNTIPKQNEEAARDVGFYRASKTVIDKPTKNLILQQDADIYRRLNLVVNTFARQSINENFGGIESFTIESVV